MEMDERFLKLAAICNPATLSRRMILLGENPGYGLYRRYDDGVANDNAERRPIIECRHGLFSTWDVRYGT